MASSRGTATAPTDRRAAREPQRELLLATHSPHKLAELQGLLDLPGVRFRSPADVGISEEPVEDARTFRGNALLKARFYARRSGLPTLADDSGIEVDALDGGPGVQTKRYAGPDATDADNNALLLRTLEGLPHERRGARYRCVLAFIAAPGADPIVRSASMRGRIATRAQGDGGFGYDPIFEPWDEPPGGRTVGRLTQAEKDRRSHRGKAARAMARHLRATGWAP
jgi:XTP/dITP diphosphohydrolase